MKRPSLQSVAIRNKRGDSIGSPSVRKSWRAVLPTVKMAASSSNTGIPKAIGSCSNLPSYNHAAHDLFEGENRPIHHWYQQSSYTVYNIWLSWKYFQSETLLLKPNGWSCFFLLSTSNLKMRDSIIPTCSLAYPSGEWRLWRIAQAQDQLWWSP